MNVQVKTGLDTGFKFVHDMNAQVVGTSRISENIADR